MKKNLLKLKEHIMINYLTDEVWSMDEKIKVSIIVPVYNVEKYIHSCIKSLINQTLTEIEIILIDDGSTDSSGRICDQYADQYENIVVFHQENAGLGMARNEGLRLAKGSYIGFVDSDDFVSNDMFELLYNNIISLNADASYCLCQRFSNEDEINITKQSSNESKIVVYKGKEVSDYLLSRIGTEPGNKKDISYPTGVVFGIYSKKLIDKYSISFVSERNFISEDMIFNIDFISKCTVVIHSNQKKYYYRYNNNSLTSTYKSERFEQNIIMYKELRRRLLYIFPDKKIEDSVSRYLIKYARIATIEEVKFEKINGKSTSLGNIRKICENEIYREVLENYPIIKLPIKYAIICLLHKKQKVKILRVLLKLAY